MTTLLFVLLNGMAVLALPAIIPGIKVADYRSALRLVLVMAVLSWVINKLFWVLVIPFKILTLGLGAILIKGLVLDVASDFAGGVQVDSFVSALKGGLALTILQFFVERVLLPG